jgi:hypothetical protein
VRLVAGSKRYSRSIRTTFPADYKHLSMREKELLGGGGSVSKVLRSKDGGDLQMLDSYRLEWGKKLVNRGTLTVHGTAEQARALMTHAAVTLQIYENKTDKETVRNFMLQFCEKVVNYNNKSGMWWITRDIPESTTPVTAYMRAQSFLRSLLVRTLKRYIAMRLLKPHVLSGRKALDVDVELLIALRAKGYGYKRIASAYLEITGEYISHYTARRRIVKEIGIQ